MLDVRELGRDVFAIGIEFGLLARLVSRVVTQAPYRFVTFAVAACGGAGLVLRVGKGCSQMPHVERSACEQE
ncbi:MAG: hypothetical protein ACRYG5_03540 [Janthinobacterium lividum]